MKFSQVRPPYSGLRTGLLCFVFLLMLVVCLFVSGFKTLKIARVSSAGFIEGFHKKGKPYRFAYFSAIYVSWYLTLEWTRSTLLNPPEIFTQVVFFYFGLNFCRTVVGEVVV